MSESSTIFDINVKKYLDKPVEIVKQDKIKASIMFLLIFIVIILIFLIFKNEIPKIIKLSCGRHLLPNKIVNSSIFFDKNA